MGLLDQREERRLNKSDYHKYLASREWALKKEAVRKRSGGICERCHYGKYQQTHHLTYEHIGDEPLSELLGVCSDCHKFISGKTDLDPASVESICKVLAPLCFNCLRTVHDILKPISIKAEGPKNVCADNALEALKILLGYAIEIFGQEAIRNHVEEIKKDN